MRLPLIKYDETNYPHYPDTDLLRKKLSSLMLEIPKDEIEVGDILLLNIGDRAQHLAIVSEYKGQKAIIHAYAPARAVVEHILDEWWKDRIVAAFRVK
ncbi:MAG: hypothetical protein R3D71_07415 [Rickettsiales bacterium]